MSRAPRCTGIAGRVWRCRRSTRHESGRCWWHRAAARIAARTCVVCGPSDGRHGPVIAGCTVCAARDDHYHVLLVDRTGTVTHQEARCGPHVAVPLAWHARAGAPLRGDLSASLSPDELRARADELEAEQCTGIAATWCPRCGDCSCPEGHDLEWPSCPLHSDKSNHAAGPADG